MAEERKMLFIGVYSLNNTKIIDMEIWEKKTQVSVDVNFKL